MGVQEYINKRNQLAASRNPNGFADNSSQPTGSTTFVQNEKKEPSISLADYAKVPDIYEPESRYKERYDNFYNEVIGARDFGVETEEQRKKREHGDAIRLGFAGLTDGLSALANLYYTTKGAPPQQISGAGTNQLVKDLYNERMERDRNLQRFRDYTRAKADKKEDEDYKEGLLRIKNEYEDRKENNRFAQQIALQSLKDKNAAKRAEQGHKNDMDLEEAKQGNRVKLAGINNDAAARRSSASNASAERRAEFRAANSSSGNNSTIRVPIGKSGEYAEYRKSDFTSPVIISQIYNSLPEEYAVRDKKMRTRKKEGSDKYERYYPIVDSPSTQQMQEAIGKALSEGYLTEMVPEIQINRKAPIKKQSLLPGAKSQTTGTLLPK